MRKENLYRTNLNDKTPVIERYRVWITNLLTKFDFGMTPTGDNVNRDELKSSWLLFCQQLFVCRYWRQLGCLYRSASVSVAGPLLKCVASILLVIPTVVMAILNILRQLRCCDAGTRIFYVTDLSSGIPETSSRGSLTSSSIILPTIVLTIVSSVGYHLSQRTYLLDLLQIDRTIAQRASLVRKKAIRKHALRVSLIPTAVSVAHLQVSLPVLL